MAAKTGIPNKTSEPDAPSRADKVAAAARIFRDWVGVPGIIVAFALNYWHPTVGAVKRMLGIDHANVAILFLNRDFINIGVNDRAPSNYVEKVDSYEARVRISISNTGYSAASLTPTYWCFLPSGPFQYQYYDEITGKPILPVIQAGETKIVFTRVLPNDGSQQPSASKDEAGKCSFKYLDKYGPTPPTATDAPEDLELISEAALAKETDFSSQYCQGMITKVKLTPADTADCVSSTHAIAIERSYRWGIAVQRALAYSADFANMTAKQSTRQAGLLLICNAQYSDCTKDNAEMSQALAGFEPPITVWTCTEGQATPLNKCNPQEFPVAAAGARH
ncbi:hypothetical protein AB0V79_24405 [Mesorhizobium ciceri]|uniref:hypothetical protein n=1 Tax=Mesorhizobium TaxID=68287 RepID=UPI000A4E8DDF|nr:hypothetical protein [Mesorhizobium ciceri]